MTVLRSAFLFALALSIAAPIVSAEGFSPRVRKGCTGDAKRLCPKHKLGSPEMRYCMEANARALSSECVRALEDDGIAPRGYLRRQSSSGMNLIA